MTQLEDFLIIQEEFETILDELKIYFQAVYKIGMLPFFSLSPQRGEVLQ